MASAALRHARVSSFFWIFVFLLVLVIVFATTAPRGTFLTLFNLQSVLQDASVLLILATAATLVIVGGGLDLSLGSVLTFSAVASMLVMKELDPMPAWSVLLIGTGVALVCGCAWGAFNGVLVAYVRIAPFVVTLGSLGAALGAARILSDGTNVSGGPAALQERIGLAYVGEVPVPFLIGAAVALVFGGLLAITRFGEHVYLVGSNEEAARRGGINVRRHQLTLYIISGGLAGFAGMVDVARFNTASVQTGHTAELIGAIAAVIIGGASLFGGVGTIAGTAVGVFIPTVLNNGLVILGFQRFWQDATTGLILIAAVAFDQWRRRRDESQPAGDGGGKRAPPPEDEAGKREDRSAVPGDAQVRTP